MKSLLKFVAAVVPLCLSFAAAAEWPEKPIRVIVPYTAGVGGDIMMRFISDDLAKRLGQPIVVDNREGAGGNVGVMLAAKSPADGYTFLVGQTSNFVINHLLYKSFNVEPPKAFVPVIHMGNTPSVLLTNLNVPANDVKAFLAAAKAQKGKLNFGSPGVGTPVHLTLAALNSKFDLGMASISYRGATQVLTGVVSGELNLGFALQGQAQTFIDTGRVRPLAVLGSSRLPALPNTPTFDEAGLENVGGETWWAMVAPVGTPTAIVDRMNAAVRQALTAPDVRKRLEDMGVFPIASTREEITQKFGREAAHWARTVKDLNIPVLE